MFTLKRLAGMFMVALLATFAPYSLEVGQTENGHATVAVRLNKACAGGACTYDPYSICNHADGTGGDQDDDGDTDSLEDSFVQSNATYVAALEEAKCASC